MLASGAMHESSGFFQPCPAGDILSKSAAALNSSFCRIFIFIFTSQRWFLENFANPYPDDPTKRRLMEEAKITDRQLGNWLSNTRVRVWKPLLEKQRRAAELAAAASGTSTSSI
jgi:hypothetical protein